MKYDKVVWIIKMITTLKPCKYSFMNTSLIWKMYKVSETRENLKAIKLAQTKC